MSVKRKLRCFAGIAAVFVLLAPAVLLAVGPASASVIDLRYTNLVGLPEGSITFGTVNTDSGSSLTWTLNSFAYNGITYTAVGFDQVCWDNGGHSSPQNRSTTLSLTNNCDGFGFFKNEQDPPPFQTPKTFLTDDTTGGFAGHIKWDSSNGGSCTGWIGSFAPHNQDATNGCAAPSAVPEPGTLVLVGSTMAGVIPFAWVRRRRAQP